MFKYLPYSLRDFEKNDNNNLCNAFIYFPFLHDPDTHQQPLNIIDLNDEKSHSITEGFCREERSI